MIRRTKTFLPFRAIYAPDGNRRRPWLVQRRSLITLMSSKGLAPGDLVFVFDGKTHVALTVDRAAPDGLYAWSDVPTFGSGPARFADRDFAINCAWNLAHFTSICSGRCKARPTRRRRRGKRRAR
jgi:hypothetical protein